MEKNETLYKKIEDCQYSFFRHFTTGLIALGGIGALTGYLIGEKVIAECGYGVFLMGAIWKSGARVSEKRFEPVSELEEKVEEK